MQPKYLLIYGKWGLQLKSLAHSTNLEGSFAHLALIMVFELAVLSPLLAGGTSHHDDNKMVK